jgi:predicted nucleotide-binding protein (sugar kinase/HSP70/actin superfamily)
MVKVGIPRSLLDYQYYPMWRKFCEELGAETVVSPVTNEAILLSGSSRTASETCLPVKIFVGHVLYLANKCDCMFVPAVRSTGGKIYNCSKFLGLPDITRAVAPESPVILDLEIDLSRGQGNFLKAVYALGNHFTPDRKRIKAALEEARKANLVYRERMVSLKLTAVEAIGEESRNGNVEAEAPLSSCLTIAVLGHPYVLHDDHLNHRLLSRLRTMGVEILTAEMVEQEKLNAAMVRLVGKPHWTFESDIIGMGGYCLEKGVDGIISASVFGCGPDSMMVSVVRHRARELDVPFLSLSLDEHASEVGIVTRLEAFLDMIRRRKRSCV